MSVAADQVYTVARLFRLQWEPAQNAWVLLYPEGMVQLNQSAGEIMKRLDGTRTLADVTAGCEADFATTGLLDDVLGFVAGAVEQGWVRRV
ncbi:pyrroloquinoline quinone biosynthesis peptide chaperone PqqD [Solimonas marina]|uniref:Pyrroloquinoline quinone biosynthesis peptide chaperone PqqD n=1 Tax=Solimonas marina TaxID=2714601 RepID=A0A969W791_9GAMM|nr:pyrroloquinoline quinone biosynthesis peptide chaperone PqqD [Solimonas marina]NKF21902.1 pyrroloquinoline quinone biosynthesis peptide chaperone PqqD [Solimonas marina]